MAEKNLSYVLSTLRKIRRDTRTKHVDAERLRQAERELEIIGRSGKWDRRRFFRAVKLTCDILNDVVNSDVEPH